MSEDIEDGVGLNKLLAEALNAVLHDYQILRVVRSFTNEIIGYEKVFDSNPNTNNHETILISDYRVLYTIKKVLGINQKQWFALQDRKILSLSEDEILVVPFDGHRHQPLPEQISLVLGFDGVSHLVTESVSLRLINKGLENLIDNHQPFAFGVINIDNYQALVTSFDHLGHLKISERLLNEIKERLAPDDVIAALSDNEFATILECNRDINEVFPRLWDLSNLSNTPLSLGEMQIPLHFSAGYVLVTDPCTTAKEILDEATSMMYKSKSNGKNGYYLSDSHHSASDPSL